MTDNTLNTSETPYTLEKSQLKLLSEIKLPTSKSISNRVLIIDILSDGISSLVNLSNARDTVTMQRLLQSDEEVLDVLDAGTTMRFLLAYLTATNQVKILTGTDRMKQRPIRVLVDALRQLGAEIEYLDKQGYPPIQINGFDQKASRLSIQGDVSSQYISALLMIAPILPKGLSLTLEGAVGSKPYIEMTLNIMKLYGISYKWINNVISINTQPYQPVDFTVEGDWSGASYWYSFVALSDDSSVVLEGLTEASLQGDQSIVEIMKSLGVNTTYTEDGAVLTKIDHQTTFNYDFMHSPDLTQTVAVVCAAKGINAIFTGLESLKIKETDRVLALQTELSKIGASMNEEGNEWILVPSPELPTKVDIHTYEDHRMAMAFAPLSLLMDVDFDDATVVNKSYPDFWKDVEKAVHKTT
jgi:3-phosphoshikimate 1-carboxyvinyltransferase